MAISVVSLLNRPPPTGVWHHLRETAGALPAHIKTLVSPSSWSQTAGHPIFPRACDRPRGKRTGSKRIPTGSRRERANHRHLPGKLEAWRASLPYVCLPDPGCAPTIWVTTAVPKRYRPPGEPSGPWADVLNGSHLCPSDSPPNVPGRHPGGLSICPHSTRVGPQYANGRILFCYGQMYRSVARRASNTSVAFCASDAIRRRFRTCMHRAAARPCGSRHATRPSLPPPWTRSAACARRRGTHGRAPCPRPRPGRV